MANYPLTTTNQFTGSIDLTDGGSVGIGTTTNGMIERLGLRENQQTD